jgi:hypothetical protein
MGSTQSTNDVIGAMESTNNIFKTYCSKEWTGLTVDEAIKEVNTLFGNTVRYEFRTNNRMTEEYRINFITFIINSDNKVIRTTWG